MENMWVIDFESSGLHRSSYPIEVGMTNGQQEYQALISPMAHWAYWSDEAQQIHGISRGELSLNGRPSADVANELNNILNGDVVYCDAIAWDGFWARVLFSDNGIRQKFDLCDISDLIIGNELLAETFINIRQKLIDSGDYKLHRALDDARLLKAALNDVI
ncbi:hypothetical protein A9Q88_12865 [Gammaproteobacteria bacterium 50_400_T64]|nr:hypothetical protein A9Q88_12865 [Gammaproteobacteria bacterium 50_400_T64]